LTSKYRSNKSVAKNPTISIDVDDPRVRWDQIKQTLSRQGSEIDIVGLDGKSLVAGGSNLTSSPSKIDKNVIKPREEKVPGEIINLSAEWQDLDSGPALVFSFDIDLDIAENTTVDSFEYTLSDGTSITPRLYSTKLNTASVTQEIIFYYSENTKYFGIFQTTFTEFIVRALDKDGGLGPEGILTNIPSYIVDLCTPIITATPIPMGYSVTLTDICTKPYEFLSVEEIVSDAASAPTTGYQQVYLSKITPANILTPTTVSRWVKARYTSGSGLYGPYSNAVKVKPSNPIEADLTPPAAATAVTAVWSGNNISITATVPSDLTRFIVRLTNGSAVGFFTKFPAASGTSQTILITEQELYNTLGSYFTSFTGLLILVDNADNRNTGTAFTVAEKVNELANVTPTFEVTPISNGYSVNYTLPAAAAYAKVYSSSTNNFTPDDATNLVYSGLSPAIIINSSYTLNYVKIKFFKTDGAFSLISAQKSVTPADPGMLSLIDNEVKISTNGSILAGDSATSGGRAILNKEGLFVYNTGGTPSTQIVANATDGSPTFLTTNAKIADWKIYSNKIENQLITGITKYAGLSASGTYAFWAGSTTSGGDAQSQFSVTQDGAVQAKNINISGGSLSVGASSIAASTGKLITTDAEITGKITASSGKITGNFQVESGTFFTGTSPTSTSVLINDKGLASIDASNNTLTAILNTPISSGNVPIGSQPAIGTLPNAISFFTQAALIGGWVVNSTQIKDRSSQFVLDSTAKTLSITGVIDVSTNFKVELGTGANVFSAGVVGQTASTSITRAGLLTANNATIRGTIKAQLGGFGQFLGDTLQHGWTVTGVGNLGKLKAEGAAEIDISTGGVIKVGDYHIKSGGSDFSITNIASQQNILTTDTLAGISRIFLGQEGRQVELSKNAEISGSYSGAAQDYRSGGLRNMYTIVSTQFSSSVFPDAGSGSVLLVYTP
jgi:hypothetical protein